MNEFSSAAWRLSNLYKIKDEASGRSIPYTPRPEQQEVIRHLVEDPDVPLFIIKSRRLGMSTCLGTFMADAASFNAGFKGNLIDQTQADAHRKMVDIIRFGIMSLPEEILSRLTFPKRNDGELTIVVDGEPETATSTIAAGMGARGGTSSMLWVSEWGPISAMDPTRSQEIRTGALPSARQGRRVVETTWYGGKGGDLWDLIKPILEKDPNAEGRVLFFPWHGDPNCVRTSGAVPKDLEEYFTSLGDRLGRTFSREQKQWYAARKLEQGVFVKREYPSTLDEAMSAPVEGAIYADSIMRLREEGRIIPFQVDYQGPVHTFWDIGSPRNTVVWYVQFLANEIRVIDCDVGYEGNLTERIAMMSAKGYPMGTHYLPHDSAATKTSGKTFQQELMEAGFRNTRCVPRTGSLWIGINRLLQLFPRLTFRLPHTQKGIESLENYHVRRVAAGSVLDEPVHDWASHASDALRYMAEAVMHGMVEGGNADAMAARRPSVPVIMGFRGDELTSLRF